MKKVTKKEYDKLVAELEKAQEALQGVEVINWWKSKDKLTIKTYDNEKERVSVMCNSADWEYAKSKNLEDVMFIEIFDASINESAGTVMTVDDMTELRDYLDEKIDYLTSN